MSAYTALIWCGVWTGVALGALAGCLALYDGLTWRSGRRKRPLSFVLLAYWRYGRRRWLARIG